MSYIPWTEKYKPTSFEAFKTSNVIFNTSDHNYNNFHNCILYGNPGCGKTSYIHLLTKKIYAKEDINYCVLSLNASDERGINTVRKKIKTFAKQTNYKKYKFKIIILDEADSLTYEAQTALRRIIEVYSNNTRFCFICNYENKIIAPIKSRCNIIKFNNFSSEYIKNYINQILEKENLLDYKQYIDLILKISKNDLRKSIIYMETLTKLKLDLITEDNIYDMFGILNIKYFKNKLNEMVIEKDVSKYVDIFNTYSINDIINQFIDIIVEMEIEDDKKCDIFILLSEIDNIKNKNIDYNIILTKLLTEYLILRQ
jgi:DNA polymerase III delta prime subunit